MRKKNNPGRCCCLSCPTVDVDLIIPIQNYVKDQPAVPWQQNGTDWTLPSPSSVLLWAGDQIAGRLSAHIDITFDSDAFVTVGFLVQQSGYPNDGNVVMIDVAARTAQLMILRDVGGTFMYELLAHPVFTNPIGIFLRDAPQQNTISLCITEGDNGGEEFIQMLGPSIEGAQFQVPWFQGFRSTFNAPPLSSGQVLDWKVAVGVPWSDANHVRTIPDPQSGGVTVHRMFGMDTDAGDPSCPPCPIPNCGRNEFFDDFNGYSLDPYWGGSRQAARPLNGHLQIAPKFYPPFEPNVEWGVNLTACISQPAAAPDDYCITQALIIGLPTLFDTSDRGTISYGVGMWDRQQPINAVGAGVIVTWDHITQSWEQPCVHVLGAGVGQRCDLGDPPTFPLEVLICWKRDGSIVIKLNGIVGINLGPNPGLAWTGDPVEFACGFYSYSPSGNSAPWNAAVPDSTIVEFEDFHALFDSQCAAPPDPGLPSNVNLPLGHIFEIDPLLLSPLAGGSILGRGDTPNYDQGQFFGDASQIVWAGPTGSGGVPMVHVQGANWDVNRFAVNGREENSMGPRADIGVLATGDNFISQVSLHANDCEIGMYLGGDCRDAQINKLTCDRNVNGLHLNSPELVCHINKLEARFNSANIVWENAKKIIVAVSFNVSGTLLHVIGTPSGTARIENIKFDIEGGTESWLVMDQPAPIQVQFDGGLVSAETFLEDDERLVVARGHAVIQLTNNYKLQKHMLLGIPGGGFGGGTPIFILGGNRLFDNASSLSELFHPSSQHVLVDLGGNHLYSTNTLVS